MSGPERRVWFVTGATSGLGLSLVRLALARGERVFATGRNAAALATLKAAGAEVAAMDVTKPAEVAAAAAAAIARFGGIDVLVNSAGYALLGAIEETSDAETRAQFEVNVFGLMNVVRAALPSMRARGGGRIVNFSSLAGFMGMAGAGNYCASKFAVEGLSETLAGELAPFGIKVIIVEPGSFKTNFVDGTRISPAMDAYADSVGRLRAWMETDGPHQGGDPEKAALAVWAAIDAGEPPLRLLVGEDALGGARAKLSAMQQGLDAWADTALMKNL
ncbi:SDR family NAD(P)-dependent oxidoreductase [Terricaulis sp.]|uniref:SDR family NAD(P)-dependent oxidoreductase n=1 Tax=Terricaulis sp. TaxID=2768686 RepID=UPI0037848B74